MFKLTLERQIPLAFIIVILLLAVIGFLSYISTNSISDAVKWEKHTQQVLISLDDLLILTLNAETGVRGYINTGNDDYLEALKSSQKTIPDSINSVRQLTSDNTDQSEKLKKLEVQINDKLLYLRQSTELRRSRGLNAAIEMANTGRGQVLMDSIRQSINEMKGEENSLLAKREADLTNSLNGTNRMMLLGSIAGIISIGLANFAIFRETGKRRNAEDQLKETNKNLEERVVERTNQLTQSNNEISEQEENFRALVESISQAVWTIDTSGQVREEAAKWWRNLTGQTEQQSEGLGWLDAVHPDDREQARKVWTEAMEKKEVFQTEYRVRERSGTHLYFSVRGIPLFNQNGSFRQWIGTLTDVTDRKNAEREREKILKSEQNARKEAEIANRLRDEFLATVSHELRAPLNSILGWSKLIQQGKLDEKSTPKAIETIVRNANSQNRLIEDLLDVSRIISGKLRLDIINVKISKLVESAMETVRPAAEAKNITLEVNEDTAVNQVSADPNRLQQVIWNLLSNAIKFTPNNGKVSVEINRIGSEVEISVKDTGVGIKPEFLPHVFERFRQADNSSIRKFGGLGLGLAIVRHITEMHGGTVYATSEGENRGATFIVRLPLIVESAKVEDRELPAGLLENTSVPEANVRLNGLLILVVDDEIDTRQLLVQALTHYGATIITASSAEEALTEITTKNPDVLISDIGMPEEDGYSLIRKVRALPNGNSKIQAVALTAFTRSQDRMHAISAGFQNHLAKPVEIEELVTVIGSLTGRLQGSEE